MRKSYKEHNHKWKKEHPERVKAIKNRWKKKHPELVRAAKKRYNLTHPQELKEYRRKYYLAHREQMSANIKKYRAEHKDWFRLYTSTYAKKYRQEHKNEIAQYWKHRRRTPKGKQVAAKHSAKRRGLGSIFLNKPFDGSTGHHIDKQRIIHIPKDMHKSVSHSVLKNINMDKINKLAFDFLKQSRRLKGDI